MSLPITPTITTAVNPTSFTLGGTATDTATIFGATASGPPGGTVTFLIYDNPECAGVLLILGPVGTTSINSFTSQAVSPPFGPTAAGTYYFVAQFSSGDTSIYTNTATLCGDAGETLIVDPIVPTVTTQLSSFTIVIGNGASDTATITGTTAGGEPTGFVVFSVFGESGCTSLVATLGPVGTTSIDGETTQATSPPFIPTTTGTYYFTAQFNSTNDNYAPKVNTPCGDTGEVLTVIAATPVITSQLGASSIIVGSSVQDVAFVRGDPVGGPPLGTVTFLVFTNDICSGMGLDLGTVNLIPLSPIISSATSPPFTPSIPGTYYFIIHYSSGETSVYNDSVSTCGDIGEVLTVLPVPPISKPVLTSIAMPALATPCQPLFDTATLTGAINPTGTITFRLFGPSNCKCNGSPCASPPISITSVPVNGNGTYNSPPVFVSSPGQYFWLATYSGDATNPPTSTICGDPAETVIVTCPKKHKHSKSKHRKSKHKHHK